VRLEACQRPDHPERRRLVQSFPVRLEAYQRRDHPERRRLVQSFPVRLEAYQRRDHPERRRPALQEFQGPNPLEAEAQERKASASESSYRPELQRLCQARSRRIRCNRGTARCSLQSSPGTK
jgi:hypothetical protein